MFLLVSLYETLTSQSKSKIQDFFMMVDQTSSQKELERQKIQSKIYFLIYSKLEQKSQTSQEWVDFDLTGLMFMNRVEFS